MRALILWFAFFATLLIPILLLVLLSAVVADRDRRHGAVARARALADAPSELAVARAGDHALRTDANEVWLTIDDGPTDDTPALLDALDARDVKATFFVKGALAAQHPDLVRMMLDARPRRRAITRRRIRPARSGAFRRTRSRGRSTSAARR